MKLKLMTFVVMMVFLFSMSTLVLAQENTSLSENDVDVSETQIMQAPYGAQVRLLQLENALDKAIATGNEVVADLNKDEQNTTAFEEILGDLVALKENVASMNATQENASALASEYVAIKKEARDLIHTFRTQARPLVTENDIEAIQERARERIHQQNEQAQVALNLARNKFNAHNAEKIMNQTGMGFNSVGEKIRSGSMSVEEFRQQVMAHVKNMTSKQRGEVAMKMQEDSMKQKVFAKAARERVQEHRSALQEGLMQRRSQARNAIQDMMGGSNASDNAQGRQPRGENGAN